MSDLEMRGFCVCVFVGFSWSAECCRFSVLPSLVALPGWQHPALRVFRAAIAESGLCTPLECYHHMVCVHPHLAHRHPLVQEKAPRQCKISFHSKFAITVFVICISISFIFFKGCLSVIQKVLRVGEWKEVSGQPKLRRVFFQGLSACHAESAPRR